MVKEHTTSTHGSTSSNSLSKPDSFPVKLYHVVCNSEYIKWSQDGDSFYIPDNDLFTEHELQASFNNKNMYSFSRQLLVYGFKRITDRRRNREGPMSRCSAFYHPYFRRDYPEDVHKIKREQKYVEKNTELKFIQVEPNISGTKPKKKTN